MSGRHIRVLLTVQKLQLWDSGQAIREYPVSTSAFGAGELQGSKQTPRGQHEIAEKIGHGQTANAVFVGRKATGEVCTADLLKSQPDRDWILSRILWLRGLEDGRNKGALWIPRAAVSTSTGHHTKAASVSPPQMAAFGRAIAMSSNCLN
jgi:hypothetical protein